MKTLRWLAVLGLGVAGIAYAANVTMDGPMTDSNAALGQAYQKRFNLNLDDHNIDYVSAQVVYSSGAFADSTFTSGSASSITITVVTNTGLSTAAASGSFTMVSTSVALGVAGSANVGVSSNVAGTRIHITGPPGDQDYTVGAEVAQGFSSTNTAVNLRDAINISSNTSLITASVNAASTTVIITCVNTGTFCNSYAVTSTSAAAISTAAFASGADAVKATIGGYAYRAGAEFAVGASTAAMASNLAAVIQNSSGTTGVTASTTATVGNTGVVFTTATTAGSAGNFALASSNPLAITTSAYTMTGGYDNATLTINGVTLTANRHWYPGSTTAQTADSLYAAINSSFTIVRSSDIGATSVIYTTSTAVGTNVNYTVVSSTQAALKIVPFVSSNVITGIGTGTMVGGSSASYTLNSSALAIANHGFPVGLVVSVTHPVGGTTLTYSTSSLIGTNIALASGSTWYTVPSGANTLGLATSSTMAIAGLPVIFTSSGTSTTADNWVIHVATAAGTTSYGWYGSNDGANFFPMIGTSSTTLVSGDSYVYPSTFSVVDFGNVNYKWLQLNVAPSQTSGAMAIKAYIHGEER